jgi:arylsulfatase A-like enzyme
MRVLAVILRGLNLGYLGCYGNEWVATPTLDRLAAQGVVFDQHFADQPDDTGAASAWQTGRYTLPLPDEPDQPGPAVFPQLAEQGIETFLVASASAADCRGWKHLCNLEPADGHEPILEAVTGALDQLASASQWLLRVELSGLLPPWNVPEPHRNRYAEELEMDEELPDSASEESDEAVDPARTALLPQQVEYAAAVTYLDEGLGQLLEVLDERDPSGDVLVLVTTDQGQSLGERSQDPAHLHETRIHLPLLLRLPNQAEAGRRIAFLTQPVDLVPTLFEAFGLPSPEVHGRSLLPLARGQTGPLRAYACAGLRRDKEVEWALRTPDWAFLLPLAASPPGRPQLYVKPEDRWEVNDVVQHHPDLAEKLEQTLRGFVEAARRPGPLQPPPLPDAEGNLNPSEGGNSP